MWPRGRWLGHQGMALKGMKASLEPYLAPERADCYEYASLAHELSASSLITYSPPATHGATT